MTLLSYRIMLKDGIKSDSSSVKYNVLNFKKLYTVYNLLQGINYKQYILWGGGGGGGGVYF